MMGRLQSLIRILSLILIDKSVEQLKKKKVDDPNSADG